LLECDNFIWKEESFLFCEQQQLLIDDVVLDLKVVLSEAGVGLGASDTVDLSVRVQPLQVGVDLVEGSAPVGRLLKSIFRFLLSFQKVLHFRLIFLIFGAKHGIHKRSIVLSCFGKLASDLAVSLGII